MTAVLQHDGVELLTHVISKLLMFGGIVHISRFLDR